jgi:predicted pyridoxine 5'-phosphate oxidase superfamily flavin-nucleotide-binding protein
MSGGDVFHSGEKKVQERAGARAMAAKLGPRMVMSELPPDFAEFLEHMSFIYIAVAAADGQVWVSVLIGPSGFARAASSTRIEIDAPLAPEDPVGAELAGGSRAVGMLVIEPMTRSRIRLNGTAHMNGAAVVVELRECFGNCPKYIQRRHPVAMADKLGPATPGAKESNGLDATQSALVEAADTFVIGTRHPDRGADASHRGGRPGFVCVSNDGASLTFPDYQGNMMFQTLGNLAVEPHTGLLFVDWDTGRTLQISGTATIEWDSDRIARWPKAERLIDVHVEKVVDRAAGLPVVWELVETHRLNPALPEHHRDESDRSGG